MNETERNMLAKSRADLVVSLSKFCEVVGEHDPCLNNRHCDECDVRKRIDELKDYVFFDWQKPSLLMKPNESKHH